MSFSSFSFPLISAVVVVFLPVVVVLCVHPGAFPSPPLLLVSVAPVRYHISLRGRRRRRRRRGRREVVEGGG